MSGGRPDALVVLQAAAGGGGLGKFKCDDDTGYNCMGRYDRYSRLTVSALACFDIVHGRTNAKSLYAGSVLMCGVW